MNRRLADWLWVRLGLPRKEGRLKWAIWGATRLLVGRGWPRPRLRVPVAIQLGVLCYALGGLTAAVLLLVTGRLA